MSLAEKLKAQAEEKMVSYAFDFYEGIENQIKESANNGYGGRRISIDQRSDFHILTNEKFLNNLRLLLDGCEVEIRKRERTNLIFKNKYHTHELCITWGKGEKEK